MALKLTWLTFFLLAVVACSTSPGKKGFDETARVHTVPALTPEFSHVLVDVQMEFEQPYHQCRSRILFTLRLACRSGEGFVSNPNQCDERIMQTMRENDPCTALSPLLGKIWNVAVKRALDQEISIFQ